MKYQVVAQPRAQADLNQIFEWISARSPDGAARWIDAWEKAIAQVGENPLRFGLAPEDKYSSADVRQVLFRTRHGRSYRALFSIQGMTVNVLHIRGPGQRPVPRHKL